MSSEPPEEPQMRSEPNILSPASPKPIHFPTPTTIPVLEMQMDVGFNQTEAHMNDPAMHDTELRPDVWRDPNEQTDVTDHISPYSTGEEVGEMDQQQDLAEAGQPPGGENIADSTETAPTGQDHDLVTLSNSASHEANSNVESELQQAEIYNATSEPNKTLADFPTSNPDPTQSQIEDVNVDQASNAHPFNGVVDVQSLLDTLQTAPASNANEAAANANTAPQADGLTAPTTVSPSSQIQSQYAQSNAPALPPGVEPESSPLSASGLGVPPSGLPPRPPPQEQPLIHPNYVHSQHIRDYHPHAAHPAFQPHTRSSSQGQGNVADPSSKNFVPSVYSPSNSTTSNVAQSSSYPSNLSIPGSTQTANGQQTPGAGSGGYTASPASYTGFAASPQNMYASQYPPNASTSMDARLDTGVRGEQPRPEDRPWDHIVQRKYDQFIEDERRYVSEGRWEQFPQGSRLFVGNLSSEKVTKRDIFHVFHTYGDLAQISIKQAYGFVQFLRTEDCMTALQAEQGTQIRDKKIHLEVSKPQKNRNQNTQRRSRSPPDARGRQAGSIDRYGARGGNNRGGRDDYRPGYRSPSPRRYRDRYDDRYRTRSRSPGYGRGGGRYRSPSPRRDAEDDLPLPHRAPRDVPDVQILVVDSLDRDFISWVEKAFSSRSVRVDVLLLSPRLSEQAVIRRQIMEGVVAVVKLTRANQNSGKIGLQIFDRRQGANNVKFEEYDNLDPNIAVELVMRAKQTHMPPSQTPAGSYSSAGGYGGQQYGASSMPPTPQWGSYSSQQPPAGSYNQTPQGSSYPPAYGQSQPPNAAPGASNVPANLQNLITNLDPSNLQSLLSAMGTPQSANSANPYQAQQNSAVAALQNNPALAAQLLQQQQAQASQPGAPGSGGGGAVNMQDILARLGNYQR